MKRFLILSCLSLAISAISCSKSNNSNLITNLYPPTTQIQDSSLRGFMDSLVDAIDFRDSSFIMNHLDSNVNLSFGGDNGHADFRRIWQLDNPETKFWITMKSIIELGGTIKSDQYVLPYVFSEWKDYDSFEYWAIIGEDVKLLKTSDISSDTIKSLDYDIVKVIKEKCIISPTLEDRNPFGEYDWYYIETASDKTEGFVYWKYIRSPIDYRMIIDKVDSNWKIKCLINGD